MNPYEWPWIVWTPYVVRAATAVLVVYAVAAIEFGGPEASISFYMSEQGRRNPMIVWVAGLLFAHWWWNVR